MNQPIIRVVDLAFVRYRTNDLEGMERFLKAFGMTVNTRIGNTLYMRGTDSDQYIYTTELTKTPGFIGPSFEVESMTDLEKVSTSFENAGDIEKISGPGEGYSVAMLDPDGYDVQFVYGIDKLPCLNTRDALSFNTGTKKGRTGLFQRPTAGPAHVKRVGHLILRVADFDKSISFYQKFGFTLSDSVYDPKDDSQTLVAFMKCNRGAKWTDHHTLGLARRTPIAVDHTAFECLDMDDVVLGGNYLKAQGYQRAWGVGRHILGSQIFDYWRDPHGFKIEHWTDGDLVNMESPVTRVPAGEDGPGAISQWGSISEDYLKIYPEAVEIGPEK